MSRGNGDGIDTYNMQHRKSLETCACYVIPTAASRFPFSLDDCCKDCANVRTRMRTGMRNFFVVIVPGRSVISPGARSVRLKGFSRLRCRFAV